MFPDVCPCLPALLSGYSRYWSTSIVHICKLSCEPGQNTHKDIMTVSAPAVYNEFVQCTMSF